VLGSTDDQRAVVCDQVATQCSDQGQAMGVLLDQYHRLTDALLELASRNVRNRAECLAGKLPSACSAHLTADLICCYLQAAQRVPQPLTQFDPCSDVAATTDVTFLTQLNTPAGGVQASTRGHAEQPAAPVRKQTVLAAPAYAPGSVGHMLHVISEFTQGVQSSTQLLQLKVGYPSMC